MRQLLAPALLAPRSLTGARVCGPLGGCQDCGSPGAVSGLCAECYGARADEAALLRTEIAWLKRELEACTPGDPRREALERDLAQLRKEQQSL